MIENGAGRHIDWESAYRFYCEPNTDGSKKNRKQVATQFNCSESAVAHRAAEENWTERRQNLHKIQTSSFEEETQKMTVESSNRHLQIWRDIQTTGLKMMDMYNQEIDIAQQKEDMDLLPDPYDIRHIVRMVGQAIMAERVILGLPTAIQRAEATQTIVQLPAVSEEALRRADEAFKKVMIPKYKTELAKESNYV